MRFSYSSMTTPAQVFDYNMRTRERVLLKTQEVPSGHDPDHYVTRRLMAPAADGELVPISLIHHRDTPLDGSAPCLLYGYGSYGITVPAAFNTNCLSLVDRGFVYAIAHVRGGKDKGYGWYDDGKRAHKMNTFTDFIAVARHLEGPCELGLETESVVGQVGRFLVLGSTMGRLERDAVILCHIPEHIAPDRAVVGPPEQAIRGMAVMSSSLTSSINIPV